MKKYLSPFKVNVFLSIFLSVCIFSCSNLDSNKNTAQPEPDYNGSDQLISLGSHGLDSTFSVFQILLEKGLYSPMNIVRDTNFSFLIDNPISRSHIRYLLKKYASQHDVWMISDSEPGDQISISGKIMNEKTLEPLVNVVIELVHADSLGHYFDEKSNWNPRLFAYLISDQKGEFRVGTIRPGLYKDDEGNYIPSHIHFTLELEKYRPYSDEFTFEDDSILRIQGNRELLPIATVKKSVKGIKQFNIVLYMQKNER